MQLQLVERSVKRTEIKQSVACASCFGYTTFTANRGIGISEYTEIIEKTIIDTFFTKSNSKIDRTITQSHK